MSSITAILSIAALGTVGVGSAAYAAQTGEWPWTTMMEGMNGNHHGMMSGTGCHMMCGGQGAPPTPSDNQTIFLQNTAYSPSSLHVRAGETVRWINHDPYAHTVTSDIGHELDSPYLQPGQSYSHTFTQPGTYRYHCTPHASEQSDGTYSGMVGVVVVEVK